MKPRSQIPAGCRWYQHRIIRGIRQPTVLLAQPYAEALRHFFGTKKVTITLTSTITGTAHTFHSTDDIIKEIIVARIYGGMHYRTSGVHGSVIGKKVAHWVAKHYFQP